MRGDPQLLTVDALVRNYGAHRAVDGVGFTVADGEMYTLLGPSGCGKTTTLRCVAGLIRPGSGRIELAGTVVDEPGRHIPTERRDIGMVFQSYAIWPHMTVFENAAFPLRVSRVKRSRAALREQVEEVLEIVRLGDFAGRSATQLSGGQQQRLALARALIRKPKLLLLDEPLSNLDARLRDQMRAELRDLQRRIGVTTLFVTHDQAEALSMSSRIAVMQDGRIVQEGTPRQIYDRPATRFVADFVGSANLLNAEVIEITHGVALLSTAAGKISAGCPSGVRTGDRVILSCRPENTLVRDEAAANSLTGTVERVDFFGQAIECRVACGDAVLVVRRHPSGAPREGDTVHIEFDTGACSVIGDGSAEFGHGLDTESKGESNDPTM